MPRRAPLNSATNDAEIHDNPEIIRAITLRLLRTFCLDIIVRSIEFQRFVASDGPKPFLSRRDQNPSLLEKRYGINRGLQRRLLEAREASAVLALVMQNRPRGTLARRVRTPFISPAPGAKAATIEHAR
jgi:hypothetical protein